MKKIHGVKASKCGTKVSHLFFADDSLIFGKATLQEVFYLQNILQQYAHASCQLINFDKSEVFFSCGVLEHQKNSIVQALAVKETGALPQYLGLPTLIGRSRKVIFQAIKERIQKRLQGLEEKFLSTGGREVLIKAVAQAIPQYLMSCFLIPESFFLEIQGMISRYWWSGKESQRSIYWLSWDALCKAKVEGGIGFRWLYSFNLALIAKQGWRLLMNPESLCSRVLRAKYYLNSNFLEAPACANSSFFWQGIMESRHLLQDGILWRIGEGWSIRIWEDKWIPSLNAKKPLVALTSPRPQLVSELLLENSNIWNRQLLDEVFVEDEKNDILKLKVSYRLPWDEMFWGLSLRGNFTVKTCYFLAEAKRRSGEASGSVQCVDADLFKMLWKLNLPLKIKHFVWKLARNILPTGDNLLRKGVCMEVRCAGCGRLGEDAFHVFLRCPSLQGMWKHNGLNCRVDKVASPDVFAWLHLCFKSLPVADLELFVITLWCAWYRRNKIVHDNDVITPLQVIDKAKSLLME